MARQVGAAGELPKDPKVLNSKFQTPTSFAKGYGASRIPSKTGFAWKYFRVFRALRLPRHSFSDGGWLKMKYQPKKDSYNS
jgi:hypothetical protein